MFTPACFEITDQDEIFSFIDANAFGQLISTVQGKLFSSHVPFLPSDDKTKISCHLARRNPQHTDISGQHVLITLQGPHGYISPSWYRAKGVPTWDYQAVHIEGVAKTYTDPERLGRLVDAMSHHHESSFAEPWQPEYGPAMLDQIIGVEISIENIQCTYKLSQNRSAEDQNSVIKALDSSRQHQLAQAMKNLIKQTAGNE